MHDIEERQDIELLVDEFYKKVLADKVIGYFFTEVVKIDLEKHMPIMHRFWAATLLGEPGYEGNPMHKHIALNQKSPMESQHFDRWLSLWTQTVQEFFAGPKADEAILRAGHIAKLMLFNVQQSTSK